jgi:myo-inositol-1(or 4)-monophosphatase
MQNRQLGACACTTHQVTGFGYEHDEAWSANLELFKELTDETQGVRRLGAAAVDLCHVALGG